jgi:hypothetical protein
MLRTVPENYAKDSWELPEELLHGAIDTHVHAGPWLKMCPGRVDPVQAAEQARAAGMPAIVFLDHTFGNSAGTAWMVNRAVPGIQAFGGLILTTNQGGLNPRAVKTALYYGAGAKFVSFGAHTTHHQLSGEHAVVDGAEVPWTDLYPDFVHEEMSRAIEVPLQDPISPEMEEILQIVAGKPDVYLTTGHTSGLEAMRVVELAERFGIKKVHISHIARLDMTVEQQRDAARRGAFLEGCVFDWLSTQTSKPNYYPEERFLNNAATRRPKPPFVPYAEIIRAVGVEQFVLATDYGLRVNPAPVEGMRILVSALLDVDFTPDEVRTMVSTNPKRLLDLD